tara:strand:- start:18 stop:467 length:450 start_codon:yes stop_codon:yes gene_type:complete
MVSSDLIYMKLIFETIPNTINVDSLEKYKLNQSSETNIYSEEGMFSILKNTMYKSTIEDHGTSHFTIDGNEFILDKSVIIRKTYPYKLPFNFLSKKFEKTTYALNRHSKLKLIIERSSAKIYDMYFLTDEEIKNYSISEDIVTFLSLLK